jgi:drug/metabolite transporter (DMT)-like permease
MNLSETRKGELAVLGEAVLWCLFPIVTILTYSSLSPILSLAYSTLFAAIFFALSVFARCKTEEIFNPKIFRYLVYSAFFIGWLFYGLYFWGLKYTTPGNASIIALMELFFAYLFFNVWKKQEFSKAHTWGAVLMLFGAVIILFPKNGLSFHGGDWIILAASASAPIGNYYQQKLRKMVSSETILFWRSIFTFPFFFLFAYLVRSDIHWALSHRAFWLLLLNGFFVLGLSKILWLEGIHRISVTKADAVASIGPLFTLLFAYLILHQPPTIWQLVSLIPLAVGLYLLTYEKSPK